MNDRLKATLAALAGMAVLAAIFALPALASTGVDEPWTPAMNHETYWEARFGADCQKYHNHSGFIPAAYTSAVVKDGTNVRVYNQAGPYTALGPVNPANGKHHEAPHSWVMKCKTVPTTSSSTTSSTTTSTSTSSTSSTTSTTLGTTTTSTLGTTTTSQPSTTSTSQASSTSTTDQDTTSTTVTEPSNPELESLPYTGPVAVLWLGAGLGLLLSGGYLVWRTRV